MGAISVPVFRLFVIGLAVWVGPGIFQMIEHNAAWYADPVGWVRGDTVREGVINPWPITTAFFLLLTLASLAAVWRWPVAARRPALVALGISALMLVATFAFFVPELILMFDRTETLSDDQIIAHSRTWVTANAARIALMLTAFWLALTALGRRGA